MTFNSNNYLKSLRCTQAHQAVHWAVPQKRHNIKLFKQMEEKKKFITKELLLSTGYVFGQRTHYYGMQHAMHCFSDEVISKNKNRLLSSIDFSSR